MMWLSTPQVIGLTNPSGGGGVNDELIFRSCETKDVGSFGIQLAITIRPPGFVTRTNALATSKGLGANIAPKIDRVRSKEWSLIPSKLHASPSWNFSRLRPASAAPTGNPEARSVRRKPAPRNLRAGPARRLAARARSVTGRTVSFTRMLGPPDTARLRDRDGLRQAPWSDAGARIVAAAAPPAAS